VPRWYASTASIGVSIRCAPGREGRVGAEVRRWLPVKAVMPPALVLDLLGEPDRLAARASGRQRPAEWRPRTGDVPVELDDQHCPLVRKDDSRAGAGVVVLDWPPRAVRLQARALPCSVEPWQRAQVSGPEVERASVQSTGNARRPQSSAGRGCRAVIGRPRDRSCRTARPRVLVVRRCSSVLRSRPSRDS
jgi:hypothetical protein